MVRVIEGLIGFNRHNWEQLKSELENLYDAERNDRRYISNDLKKYAKIQARKRILLLAAFKEYQRGFTTIGGWLLAKDKISTAKHAKYFMTGIHKSFARKLKNRLGIVHPYQPVDEPWAINDIVKAAEYLLARRREERVEEEDFETDDDEYDSDDEDEDDGSDSDNESDEEDEDDVPKKKNSPEECETRSQTRQDHQIRDPGDIKQEVTGAIQEAGEGRSKGR